MILTALARHGPADGAVPLGYEHMKNLGFLLIISTNSNGCQLVPQHLIEGDRSITPPALIPNVSRSNHPPPLLACDSAEFVLARPKKASDKTKQDARNRQAKHKQQAFVDLMRSYAIECEDPDAHAYVEWVAVGMPELDSQIEQLDAAATKRLDLDRIAIKYRENTTIHTKKTARDYWGKKVSSETDGPIARCLVCGRTGPTVRTLPQPLNGNLIPGTEVAQVALASVNIKAASRNASGTGLTSAPICTMCGTSAVTAFNDLAGSSRHRFNLGGKSAAIWWTSHDLEDDELPSHIWTENELDPARVAALRDSVLSGRRDLRSTGRFYLLTFSGNAGRLIVRRWINIQTIEMRDHVSNWFSDTEVPDADRPHFSLRAMAASIGQLANQEEHAPHGTFEALFLTALAGVRPPAVMMQRVVARSIAEVYHLTDSDRSTRGRARRRAMCRLAIIRLTLNRTAKQEKPMPSHLDVERKSPAYLNGRLFYVREYLQRRAAQVGGSRGSDRDPVKYREVNSSIVDRFFARAVLQPSSVATSLAVLEQRHLAKLRRSSLDKDRKAESHIKARLTEIHDRMGESPGRLSLPQQAEWIAGYYQQRAADFAARKARQAKRATDAASAETDVDE